MNLSKLTFLLFVSFINLPLVFSQDEYPTCIHPETISFPFDDKVNDDNSNEIYYQPDDVYTFWYKIVVKSDGKLLFELASINKDDSYDMLIYKYKGKELCNDIVQKKETPILNKTSGNINVKKGEIYYFSILHLNGSGCGHYLTLESGKIKKLVKAIQHDCVEEILETIVEKDTIAEIVEIPIIIPTAPIDTVINKPLIKGMVFNKNTQKEIEADVLIMNLAGTLIQQLKSDVKNGFMMPDVTDNKIIVSINKLGYEPFTDTLEIISTAIKIELIPIKVGEKIVMHKIYFHPNSYALKEESTQELLKLNEFMLENSQYSFEIQGHTNGNKAVKKIAATTHLGEEWNYSGSAKKLSKLRADKIKDYLVQHGVKETQIQTIGYGGDRMIVEKPKNMKQAMQNIRVEIIVVK